MQRHPHVVSMNSQTDLHIPKTDAEKVLAMLTCIYYRRLTSNIESRATDTSVLSSFALREWRRAVFVAVIAST